MRRILGLEIGKDRYGNNVLETYRKHIHEQLDIPTKSIFRRDLLNPHIYLADITNHEGIEIPCKSFISHLDITAIRYDEKRARIIATCDWPKELTQLNPAQTMPDLAHILLCQLTSANSKVNGIVKEVCAEHLIRVYPEAFCIYHKNHDRIWYKEHTLLGR